MDFFLHWLRRDEKSTIVQATESVSIIVTKAVQTFFEVGYGTSAVVLGDSVVMGQPNEMKHIHLWLSSRPDLLTKRFIFLH